MEKIGVLIPSYKPSEYIEECFNSINNQTIERDKFCVYVALNGPRDPYEAYILERLANVKFNYRFIYIKEPGVSNARNQLIEISNEEYLVFVDDDDRISANYLKNLLEVASRNYIGISNVYNFSDDIDVLSNNYIGVSFKKLEKMETSKFKIRKYFSSPWGKIIHRNIIENYRFDVNISKGEDALFMAMISKNIAGISKTPIDTIYYVYQRRGSVTRRKIDLYFELKNCFYLVLMYSSLLYKRKYNFIFVLTRIVATLNNFLFVFFKKYSRFIQFLFKN